MWLEENFYIFFTHSQMGLWSTSWKLWDCLECSTTRWRALRTYFQKGGKSWNVRGWGAGHFRLDISSSCHTRTALYSHLAALIKLMLCLLSEVLESVSSCGFSAFVTASSLQWCHVLSMEAEPPCIDRYFIHPQHAKPTLLVHQNLFLHFLKVLQLCSWHTRL